MPDVYIVPDDAPPDRVDVWLARVAGRSRSRIQSFIDKGYVKRDGEPLENASPRVRPGMVFEIEEPPPEYAKLVPQDIPLTIVYEDDAILVVDKPAGLIVHPAAGHPDGTLANALLFHCGESVPTINGEMRPGIIHRIDQFTSGLLVVAKTNDALTALGAEFQNHQVRKTYQCIVHGVPCPASGRIETLIARNPKDRKTMTVVEENGKPAVTNYETRDIFLAASAALMEVRIETGRTHQIRVHMRHLGHPVVGDPEYGWARRDAALGIPHTRQLLHAWRLSFAHPVTGEAMAFESPLPEDFTAALDRLRGMAAPPDGV